MAGKLSGLALLDRELFRFSNDGRELFRFSNDGRELFRFSNDGRELVRFSIAVVGSWSDLAMLGRELVRFCNVG